MKNLITPKAILAIALLCFFSLGLKAQMFVDANAGFEGLNLASAAWGDMDNDGDLDLALCGMSQNNNTAFTAIYENDNGTFTPLPGTNFTPALYQIKGPSWHQLEWGDYNNDNRLDLAMAGIDDNNVQHIEIWRNDGNNNFFNSFSLLPGTESWDIKWADVDNDGDMDLLNVGTDNISPNSRLYINDWNSGTEAFSSTNVPFPGITNGGVADFGDYDRDGDMDVVIAGIDTSGAEITQLWDNDGTGNFTHNTNPPFLGVYWGDADWADVNNDGYLDLMLTGYTAGNNTMAYVYYYDGTTWSILAGIPEVTYSSTSLGDFNHNGYPDLLLQGDTSGNLEYYAGIFRNNGSTQAMIYDANASMGIPQQEQGTAEWLDVDGDGLLDYFVSGITAYQTKLFYGIDTSLTNQPPAAPSGMVATSAGANAVNFAWTAPADDATPSIALTYHLMLDTLGGSGYGLGSALADTATGRRNVTKFGNISGTTWTLQGLTLGQTYCARVSAIDAGLAGSSFSSPSCATTMVVGIMDDESQFVLSAGPIPATSHLNLRADGINGPATIQVVSLTGQILREETVNELNGHSLDVDRLSGGMYLLRVQLKGQEKVTTLRFIKE